MVRRIKGCAVCNRRFIAEAKVDTCLSCITRLKRSSDGSCDTVEVCQLPLLPAAAASQQPLAKKQKTVIEKEATSHERSEIQPCSRADDDAFEGLEEEEICSENGDDLFCTQIVDDENDNSSSSDNSEAENPLLEQNNEYTLPKSESAPSPARSSATSAPAVPPHANNNDNICFVCGRDLNGLKRRLDHIKRCSKKHNMMARDVRVDFTTEDFENTRSVDGDQVSTAGDDNGCSDPKLERTWRLAEGQQQSSSHHNPKNCSNSTTATKQMSMTSFVSAPLQNLNNVLLAGAKRLSKMAEISASGKQAHSKSKRRSFPSRDYSKLSCPMYKRIPGTDFNCDGFHYAQQSATKNFFLTHFHSDHYGGIGRSWKHGTIYCSLPTANLVHNQLGVEKKYLHPIPMYMPTIIESRGKAVTVELLDANHCPGAVMFLFQVANRRILHVGDFRWNREIMMQQPPLKAIASGKEKLDDLYLDTTYCNPKFILPTQQDAIRETVSFVERELQRGDVGTQKILHLFGAYTIGKERIYLSVAEKFGWKVYVDSARLKILSGLGWPKERMALFTTRREEAKLWVVPLGHINMKKLPEYFDTANSKPFGAPYTRIIGYRPTGWSMSSAPGAKILNTRSSGNVSIVSVPYSEHSSFNELVDCLDCLKPRKIIPTVNASKSQEQVQTLLNALHMRQSSLPFK